MKIRQQCYQMMPTMKNDKHPQTAVTFCHIQFNIGGTMYPAPIAPLNDVNQIKLIRHAYLTFTDQKNAVKGEQIGHATTNHPMLCGAKALGRIVHRCVRCGAPPDTPTCRHYNPSDKKWYDIKSKFVTNALRHAAARCVESTGIDHMLVSARSLAEPRP